MFAASAGYSAQYEESVGSDDLADSRTLLGPNNYDPSIYPSTVQGDSTGGLDGSYTGNDFTISWFIDYDPDTDYWSYSYLLASSKTPSTFILEFTDTGDVNNDRNSIWDLVINGESAVVGGAKDEFGTWNENGGIGLINPIYGHKFEVIVGSASSAMVQFTTSRAPVWGSFHTMGAVSNNAYNTGLDIPSSADPLDFIPRPGAPPACPDLDGDGYVVCNATCDPGSLLCGDCDESDSSINPGAPEICRDRKDNDCDGKKDNGDPQGCINCTPTGTPEDICNGADDDCDGSIDEDYIHKPTTCGTGECVSTGQTTCVDGAEGDTCTPGSPQAEVCDNLDNDCNGLVDDNPVDAGGACSEGIGACQADGTEVCNAGVLECNAVPGSPTSEVCNGIDDDCDGSVDENLTQPTACGVGECAGNTGIETCTAGVWGNDTCDPLSGAAVETCDGLDNDCDSSIDEDFADLGTACTVGVGACEATGTYICAADGSVAECNAVPGLPQTEGPPGGASCSDGEDNDCDGLADFSDGDCLEATETDCFDGIDNDGDGQLDCADPDCAGAASGSCTTGQSGICSTGTLTCQGGAEVCAADNQPQAEVCDNLDNDCNGLVDDNPVDAGGACSEGIGACQADGTEVCNAGVLECNAVPGSPTSEVCNGIDDDCDGSVDENLTQPTACGVGECAGNTGIETCTAGVWGNDTCDPLSGAAVETCDGLDNDCDSSIDEDFADLGTACTVGVGVCEATGTYICAVDGSGTECDATPGPPATEGPPGSASCSDGEDNDCDGVADLSDGDCLEASETNCFDGVDDDGDGQLDCADPDCAGAASGSCTTGQSGICSTGTLTCQGGAEVCAADNQPQTEVCDNLDNDCDGLVDDNPVDAGGACSAGTGACEANGTEVCNAGVLECNAVPGSPTSEVCNGIDDDCDGSVDENLTQPTACGVGECAGNTGIETCTAGVWGNDTCDPLSGAAVDDSVCNGIDDDCDGLTDEDYVVDDTCGTGVCQANNTPSSCAGGVEIQCQPGTPAETLETTCNDGVDNDCDGQADSNDTDCGEACIPPPVGQEVGILDVLYANLIEEDCRFCHENPDQFPVLDVSIPDRHHLIVDNVIPDPTDAPFGTPGEIYECMTCHDVDSSTGIFIFLVERDCVVCHIQDPSELTVHHKTDLAQGILPQGPDCQACHGDIVDNRDDGHFIPTYSPTQSTPKRSGGTGLPFNSRGDGAGACNYCHNDGICQTGDTPIEPNMTTHHNTGFGSDSAKCDWCHDFTMPFEEQFRICENCHGRDSLHNIQTDSDGDNVINPGIELPFYGHIGNPDDCWGCHGYGASSSAPETGPVVPSISSISDSVLAEGTDTTVTLSGSAFTNMNEGTEFSSDVVITAADGSSITLIPDSISQDSISVTIPGNLEKGNYRLKTAKLTKHSNPRVISVIPNVAITNVDCDRKRGLLTIAGSGFSEKPEGTDDYINIEVNGETVDIISWTDTQIKASVSTCSNDTTVTVYALFGTAASGNGKPPKPCKGKNCSK